MRKLSCVAVAAAFCVSAAAYADHFNVRVVTDGDAALADAGPSEVVNVKIQGKLDADGLGGASTSEGLALWGGNLNNDAGATTFDLCDTNGFLLGASATAANFDRNFGLTNPPGPNPSDLGQKTGYKGTCDGGMGLLQIGGGQNTIGNQDPPQYPVGPVDLGIAKDAWVDLATGTLTTPAVFGPGDSIILTLDTVFANQLDDTGAGAPPVFGVSAADQVNIVGTLTISQNDIVPPEMTAAVSRRVHGAAGTFDIDVLAGATECRNLGPTSLVVTFDEPIDCTGGCDAGDVSVTTGSVTSVTVTGAAELTIAVSGFADAELNNPSPNTGLTTVTFPGIEDLAGNVNVDSLCVRKNHGDVDGNGTVTVTDRIQVQQSNGLTADAAPSFRRDVDANGTVTVTDRIQVQQQNGDPAGACP